MEIDQGKSSGFVGNGSALKNDEGNLCLGQVWSLTSDCKIRLYSLVMKEILEWFLYLRPRAPS